ncbi:MAG: PqqD family protein [Oscillospiraceae bacterium]|nr:PqqD family protein [Oscillospiraceae bacterium]
MKLRYKFVVRNVGGKPVAVAVGMDNNRFNGMIRLNQSGEWIFKQLQEGPISQEALMSRFAAEFGITEETAKPAVLSFLNTLREGELLDD